MLGADPSLESLLDFYENAPCGFHSLDANGVFVRINDTELNWLGYRRDEVIARMQLRDVLTPASQRTFEEHFPQFRKNGVLRDLELEMVRKDGSTLPVLVSATAMREAGGNVTISRSVVYDLSARKQADTRFRSVLDAAPDVLLICDGDGTILLANARSLAVFGYLPDELQGKTLDLLLPESVRSVHSRHVADFFSSSTVRPMGSGMRLNGRHKNGSQIPVEISLSPLQTGEGPQALAIVRDVTDRRHTEERLRKSEARYRLMFENSIDGILVTIPDGRILDANPSACAILGLTREQVIAKGRSGIVDSADQSLPAILEERSRSGKAHGELMARHGDGHLFPMELSSAIFTDADGVQSTCTIFRDVSHRKNAEAERERLIVELQDALDKVKVLSGLLSVCASCKRIRNEEGKWEQMESYIRDRSAADFSHGICPECVRKLYPNHQPK